MTANLDEARRQWLSELYQAHAGSVFAQCRRLLNSAEDAADATQEVFIRAASSLTESPNSPEASRWLTTVARNYCIDVIRRRQRFGSALVTLAATSDAAGESVEAVEDRQLIAAVLERMGARERQALVQSAVDDLPVAEVARASGVSYLAAAQLLHRARRSALLILTRLAVILGLAQLGRAARRSKLVQHSQQLAAVVGIPLVVAIAVVSSSPPQTMPAHARTASTHSVVAAQNSVPPANAVPPASSPAPAPIPGPTLLALTARAPIGGVHATHGAAGKPPTQPPAVIPPSTPPTLTDEKDHGKGRDRDDLSKKRKKH